MNKDTNSGLSTHGKVEAPLDESIAAVCDLSAIPTDEHAAHIVLAHALFADRERVREIEGGLEFTLGPDDLDNAATFIRNERRCCRHLDFTLRVPARDSVVTLRVTGPGAADELRALVALGR